MYTPTVFISFGRGITGRSLLKPFKILIDREAPWRKGEQQGITPVISTDIRSNPAFAAVDPALPWLTLVPLQSTRSSGVARQIPLCSLETIYISTAAQSPPAISPTCPKHSGSPPYPKLAAPQTSGMGGQTYPYSRYPQHIILRPSQLLES